MTQHVRLCANIQWLFTELPFPARFEAAAKAGFEAVEIPQPYDHPTSTVKRWLLESGLHHALVNTPSSPSHSGRTEGVASVPDRREQFRSDFLKALEYAVELGTSVVNVVGGTKPPTSSADRSLTTLVTNLGWALERAVGTDVRLVIEPLNQFEFHGSMPSSTEQAADVVRALDDPRLGVLLDAYHLGTSGEDLEQRLRELGPLVGHVQVADVPGRGEPGTGGIAWTQFFEQLYDIEYAGWVGAEYRPVCTTVQGLTWRKRLGLAPGAEHEQEG